MSGTTKRLADAVAFGIRSTSEISLIIVGILGADIIEGRFKDLALIEQLKNVDTMVFG